MLSEKERDLACAIGRLNEALKLHDSTVKWSKHICGSDFHCERLKLCREKVYKLTKEVPYEPATDEFKAYIAAGVFDEAVFAHENMPSHTCGNYHQCIRVKKAEEELKVARMAANIYCVTYHFPGEEPMKIAGYEVTDLTRESAKVGCATVTAAEAKALLAAMEKVPVFITVNHESKDKLHFSMSHVAGFEWNYTGPELNFFLDRKKAWDLCKFLNTYFDHYPER